MSGNIRHFVRLGQDAIREARGHARVVVSRRATPHLATLFEGFTATSIV